MSTTLTETERVIAACAEAWEVDIEDILRPPPKKGTKSVCDARSAIALILQKRGRSLPEIGKSLRRSWWGAQHCIRSASNCLETDRYYKMRYQVALELIKDN